MQPMIGTFLMQLLGQLRRSKLNISISLVEWSFCVVNETLDKIVRGEKVTAKPPKTEKYLKTVHSFSKNVLNR